jgi:hypothetical protein
MPPGIDPMGNAYYGFLRSKFWNTCPIFTKLGMKDMPLKVIPMPSLSIYYKQYQKYDRRANSRGGIHYCRNELRAAHHYAFICESPSSLGQHLEILSNVRLSWVRLGLRIQLRTSLLTGAAIGGIE